MSQIVEVVTGQSMRDWADENIFKPLTMNDTHFHDNHNHIVRNRADGYDDANEGGFEISMTTLDMVGDGGIYTTVEDMLKWDQNFYNNKLGKGESSLIDLVETPGRLKDGTALNYAFGLSVGEFAGTREISHGGAFVGFRAGFNRYPNNSLSVAVFCNYANTNPTGLARQVASLYLEPVLTGDAETSDAGADKVVEVSAADLEKLTGEYLDSESFTIRSIEVEEGELFYVRGDDSRSRLDAIGNNRFLMADVSVLLYVSFAATGKAMTVEVEGQEPSQFERFERPTLVANEQAVYTGSYYSKELDYMQVLKVMDGTIILERRIGIDQLQPLRKDTFVSDDGVVLLFERNAKGEITGFEIQAGRVRNIGFERQH